ncbi:unnamed protein product [Notodromas monacha]|uniref:Uncharacterized protein n=1 Tax=Notodromas monacha TaxID=399045 RepID=A0A7R9BLY2_9CRUS|nr:unnamed protein product [Notodromas monacha]CAG0916603.1 unnamed protein product [Notodromas monacha]
MPAVVAAGQSPTLADVDHVSSRSSSLRSSSTAQTAILRTPQQFPDVAGHGSLQRRPRMVDSLPGSSATLPRNLNAVRNVQQLQPTPVYWNQVEPFTPPRPAFPVDPRTMGYRTSTPVLNQGQWATPRPMKPMTPVRPNPALPYELPYRQFQPNPGDPVSPNYQNLPPHPTMGYRTSTPVLNQGQWATPRPMRPMTPVRPNPALPYELPYRQFQPNPGDPVSPNYQNLPPHPYFQYYPRFGEVPHYSPVYTQQTMRKDVGYRGINPGYVASRMPVPQPRNSQYYKSSDYVNQSLCASIGVPAAAAGQVQGASSQELSTEL